MSVGGRRLFAADFPSSSKIKIPPFSLISVIHSGSDYIQRRYLNSKTLYNFLHFPLDSLLYSLYTTHINDRGTEGAGWTPDQPPMIFLTTFLFFPLDS